jgi:hypothetical protein
VLIVDTGPLVATADRADKDHLACRSLQETEVGPLVTTAMVIAEAAYPIDRQLGPRAEAGLYAPITSGHLDVADLTGEDWVRIWPCCCPTISAVCLSFWRNSLALPLSSRVIMARFGCSWPLRGCMSIAQSMWSRLR